MFDKRLVFFIAGALLVTIANIFTPESGHFSVMNREEVKVVVSRSLNCGEKGVYITHNEKNELIYKCK